MNKAKLIIYIIIILQMQACAHLTGYINKVERDEFFYNLARLNMEILGGMKYDNPNLDLKSLDIQNYEDLFKYADITEQDKNIKNFIENNVSNKKLIIKQDTFIICLYSKSYEFVLCDNAQTPEIDYVKTDKDLMKLNEFYEELY